MPGSTRPGRRIPSGRRSAISARPPGWSRRKPRRSTMPPGSSRRTARSPRCYPGKRSSSTGRCRPPYASRRAGVLPRRIAFPGPTVARKGAYELREAARRSVSKCFASAANSRDPISGGRRHAPARSRHRRAPGSTGVAAVVQPALVEERPRHLLAALAAGVPVIATAGCGIAGHDCLTIVPAGDAAALTAALHAWLGK